MSKGGASSKNKTPRLFFLFPVSSSAFSLHQKTWQSVIGCWIIGRKTGPKRTCIEVVVSHRLLEGAAGSDYTVNGLKLFPRTITCRPNDSFMSLCKQWLGVIGYGRQTWPNGRFHRVSSIFDSLDRIARTVNSSSRRHRLRPGSYSFRLTGRSIFSDSGGITNMLKAAEISRSRFLGNLPTETTLLGE